MYDVSQPESLDKCKQWVDQLRENKGQDFPIALAGNKVSSILSPILTQLQCDLPPQERKLARDAGARYAQEQGLLFEETSAKTGDNVDKLFLSLGACRTLALTSLL